ncbi:MAG: protein-glutamate O-methyltransferase CheR [Elusimicrobia bacterium]|nr:protein-glutamate O-methyltransferase CheR [Elusimicrobiota bacterium]MBP9698513.1 protein-glutamate O-methyltransferase CheR [Elusimicrobiota bacterium]
MTPPVWETGTGQIDYLGDLTRRIGGFVLEKERSLVSDPRVMDLLFREKVGTIEELVAQLRKLPEGALHLNVVESLAVSDTSFFGGCRIFDQLEKTIIPWLADQPSRTHRLTVWSAGCSTGQEAYSLAISADRALANCFGWAYQVIGSDLSSRSLRTAESGVYSQFDINCGLPASRLVDYFEKRDNNWHVIKTLKKNVSFQKLNLADPGAPYPEADVVMVRNVLSYFEPNRRADVLGKIKRAMRPDGYLILGENETVDPSHGFRADSNGPCRLYRPAP